MRILEQKVGHCGWTVALGIDDNEYFFMIDASGTMEREQESIWFWELVRMSFPKEARNLAREVEIKKLEYEPMLTTRARELIAV